MTVLIAVAQLGSAQLAAAELSRLVQFIPQNAEFVVCVRDATELEQALERSTARQALTRWLGSGAPASYLDLRASFCEMVGPTAKREDLTGVGFAIASMTVRSARSAVWLIHSPPNGATNRWFPLDQRKPIHDVPEAFLFHAIAVYQRSGVLVVAPQQGNDSLFRDIVAAMASPQVAETDLHALLSHLPTGAVAAVCGGPLLGSLPAKAGLPVGPLERVVLGLTMSKNRLDISLRATTRFETQNFRLTDAAQQRMQRLPHNTVAAYATSIEGHRLQQDRFSTMFAHYLTLLSGLRESTDPNEPVARIGPEVIVSLATDLARGGTTPQWAFLFSCDNPALAEADMRRIVHNTWRMLRVMDATLPMEEPLLRESNRLATRITSMPLAQSLENSRLAQLQALARLEPSWTALGDWLVITLTRRHAERMVDASMRLSPDVQSVPNLNEVLRRPEGCSSMGWVRGELAADVLGRWVASFQNGQPPWDQASWLQPQPQPPPPPNRRILGIGMQASQESGVVVVVRVHSGSNADGPLKPGDRILGVNGRLFDLQGPNAQLRRTIAELSEPAATTAIDPSDTEDSATDASDITSADVATLRVLRDGKFLDVALSLHEPRTPAPPNPVQILQEWIDIAKSIDTAGFCTRSTGKNRWESDVSLIFAQSPDP